MSFARATLSGTLVSQPEKRFTPNNNAVTQFQVEITPASPNDQSFLVTAVCWRNLAEVAEAQLQKGELVTLEGRLQVHRTENAGNYHSQFELDVTTLYKGAPQVLFSQTGAPSKQQQGQQQQQPQMMQQPQPVGAVAAAPSAPSQDFWATEDDIPF